MEVLSPSSITLLLEKIKQGATAIFPTETSYGLGCDASNVAAVSKIFTIKGRDPSKPLLIVVPSLDTARRYIRTNATFEKLAAAYWPGPLTIVGEYQPPASGSALLPLAPGVVADDGTVAIRVSADPWLQQFMRALDRPLVATSANRAGEPALYDSELAKHAFDKSTEPDMLVLAGLLPLSPATTLVSVVGNKLQILRQGALIIS